MKIYPKITADYSTTIHKDGTASYWSVYQQRWIRSSIGDIPVREVAERSLGERIRLFYEWKAVNAGKIADVSAG